MYGPGEALMKFNDDGDDGARGAWYTPSFLLSQVILFRQRFLGSKVLRVEVGFQWFWDFGCWGFDDGGVGFGS